MEKYSREEVHELHSKIHILEAQIEAANDEAKLMQSDIKLLREALQLLLHEADTLKEHIVDMGYIDWEDETIDGVKDFDAAITEGEKALNQTKP